MTRARRYLWCAALCGAVHAAFTFSWALGGRWLLDTVGQWALDWADRAPTAAGLALAGIGVAKAAGAAVPLLLDADRLPWPGLWRSLSLAGGVVLVLYGTANAVGAWLVLTDVVATDGPPDRAALLGHAVLWDPLFAAWGALLLLGLRRRHAGGCDVVPADGVAVPADDPAPAPGPRRSSGA